MSDREKRKLLMKESPELFGLITDFKGNWFLVYFPIRILELTYIS